MSCNANNFRARPFTFSSLLWLWLAVVSQLSAAATQSVALKWNPSADTNVAGYRIYYGTTSFNYKNVVTVGNVTNAVISGLADETTFFFAATTTDAAGNESDFSNEATFTTAAAVAPVMGNQPPTLNDLAALTVYQNAGFQTIPLSGITSGSASEKQLLKVTATSSNPNLIANPTVNYTSPNTNGALVFKPSTTLTGTSIINVTVNDCGKTNNLTIKHFSITVIAPPNLLIPRFATPLTNTTAVVGQMVTFNAAVTGKAPFKFQWKFNGLNLSGATGATLTLKTVKTNQSGAYSVLVSNSAGSTNGIVQLSVKAATASKAKAQAVVPTINPLATAATLTSVKQANGQLAIAVSGIAGCKYVVQASSDLENGRTYKPTLLPSSFLSRMQAASNNAFTAPIIYHRKQFSLIWHSRC